MNKIKEFLNYSFNLGEDVKITVKAILIMIVIFIITSLLLRVIRIGITRKIRIEDRGKFITVFSFTKYFIFLIVFLAILSNSGVKLTAILTSAAALLIGIGLALQTLFQDIISGIFILIDQSLNVDDIIEIDGKIGKVTNINLRTTRAVTIENKVMIIPNHLYLTNTLYNYTQNEKITRESVTVGVAYGSDVELVRAVLLEAAKNIKGVLNKPEPIVFFQNFGESSLEFKLVVTAKDTFLTPQLTSEIRFEIDKLFRENGITIPFPQRDIHIKTK